jgi:signal peptidase I
MQHIKKNNGKHILLLVILMMVLGGFALNNTGFYSTVQGQSMYPTFKHDDVVQTRTPNTNPRRGDVVIITDPTGERIIKRIIGLPGETLTLFLGFVYINGQRLDEPYLPRLTYTFLLHNKAASGATWKLRHDQFFVLGDNRLQSIDSRNFGPVHRSGILRSVNLPDNSLRPGFCDIILSSSGMPMRKSQMRNEEPSSF